MKLFIAWTVVIVAICLALLMAIAFIVMMSLDLHNAAFACVLIVGPSLFLCLLAWALNIITEPKNK